MSAVGKVNNRNKIQINNDIMHIDNTKQWFGCASMKSFNSEQPIFDLDEDNITEFKIKQRHTGVKSSHRLIFAPRRFLIDSSKPKNKLNKKYTRQ